MQHFYFWWHTSDLPNLCGSEVWALRYNETYTSGEACVRVQSRILMNSFSHFDKRWADRGEPTPHSLCLCLSLFHKANSQTVWQSLVLLRLLLLKSLLHLSLGEPSSVSFPSTHWDVRAQTLAKMRGFVLKMGHRKKHSGRLQHIKPHTGPLNALHIMDILHLGLVAFNCLISRVVLPDRGQCCHWNAR